MRDCCYICKYFEGRRGYRMGQCNKLKADINYEIIKEKEDGFYEWATFPIVHAKGICNKFTEIEIE